VSTDMDSAPKWNHNDSDNLRDRSMRKRIGGITVRIGWFVFLLLACAIVAESYGLAACVAASAVAYVWASRQVILDNSRG
jgi:hypothetical protein